MFRRSALMFVVVVMACGGSVRNEHSNTKMASVTSGVVNSTSEKFEQDDAFHLLSSPISKQRDSAREALLSQAKDKHRRKQIIEDLLANMNRPNLDLVSNQSDYYLWLEGAQLLGDLKATESLDLLIAHLDLNNGSFSASMNHQPAIPGIIAMGTLAVPKLAEALRKNQKKDIRQAAAFCLAVIGGKSATGTLRASLQSEPDVCVRKMIELSLDLNSKVARNKRPNASPADFDAEASARRDRLLAFWCK
jgi:HEAT repeat protein